MTMPTISLLAACALAAIGCTRPYIAQTPSQFRVKIHGVFTFSPAGELVLALSERRCIVIDYLERIRAYTTQPCSQATLDTIPVTAVTPWGKEVRGVWIDAGHIAFPIDWARSGIDPLADNVSDLTQQRWRIDTTSWQPTSADAARILKLVSDATQTEPDLVRGGPAPQLEVTALRFIEGAARSGGESTLVVGIANRGPGTAYRVRATTRSSLPSLHGRRLGFGMIKPGTDKVRTLRVSIPASETAQDVMLVLVVDEGNGFSPPNMSQRMPILASETAPVLAVQCTIANRTNMPADIEAGGSIVLHCLVSNTGTSAAPVGLETTITHAPTIMTPPQLVAVGKQIAFDVPVKIPRELALDSKVEIAIVARGTTYARTARTIVTGIIRKSKVCEPGHLTQAQYRAKIEVLRAAAAAGDLSQAQFDRYDAELVSCLQ
jgi:hypothetical protein